MTAIGIGIGIGAPDTATHRPIRHGVLDPQTAHRIRVLRDSLIDCDVVVDDLRGDSNCTLEEIRAAVARRDDVARRLEQTIAEVSQ